MLINGFSYLQLHLEATGPVAFVIGERFAFLTGSAFISSV
jgi:hypothetical protein